MLKKLILLTILVITFIILLGKVEQPLDGRLDQIFKQPCSQPIHWKIGKIDPRFNISKEDFTSDIEKAASVWEKSQNKNLFSYDTQSPFTINLIYDDRQALTSQIDITEKALDNKEQSIKPEIAVFEKRSAEFKKRLDEYNRQVIYWNNRGGAPEEEYKKFNEENQQLAEEANQLNTMAQALNQKTNQFNTDIRNLNQTIQTFNKVLTDRPEAGVYDDKQKKIDIYIFLSQNELIRTLAHELGHALGLEHIANPKAIMFSNSNEQTNLTNDDKAALEKICHDLNLIDRLKKNLLEPAGYSF